jgi:uncharacterized protein YbcI
MRIRSRARALPPLLVCGSSHEERKEAWKVNEERAPRADDGRDGDEKRASVLAEISREMVRLYKEQFGRGPTKARTNFAGPDILVCTLEQSLTPVELRLAELGEHQRLRDTRTYFQHVTKDQFCGVIERVLDRRVRAFVSGMDTEQDVSAELFYLYPDGSSRPQA